MPSYTYTEADKVLDIDTPLVTEANLLLIAGDELEDIDTNESAAFIHTAHTMVVVYLDGYSIPTVLLTEIEKYLAAHFGTLAYPAVQREGLSVLRTTFATKLGLGLQNTRYGQSAIGLDPTGILKDLSDGTVTAPPRITSLGYGVIYGN